MASVPGKAEKWFNETRKQLKHSMKGRHVKNVKNEKGMEIHTCTYCPKAFSDTRCLVMHVLRRHSDNLVLLHKNIMNVKNPEESDLLPTDIVKCIQTEFGDLKNELHSVKEIVLEFLSSNSKCQEVQSSPSVTNDLKSHSLCKSADDTIHDVSSEKGLKSIQKSCDSINSTDFESKLHDLFETYKKDFLLRDIKTEIAVNKNEILQEVKSTLQHEMRNMALHMDKSISELKKSDSELKRELVFLTELVKSNTEKINSLEASPNVGEKFEQHLQSFLNSGSLYDDKKKTKPKTPSQKQRKKKSIFTMTTSKACDNSGLHHSQKEIPNTDTNLPPKQQEITNASNPNDKVTEDTNKFDLGDIKNIVDEKLKSYNINPSVEKLSAEEFQKKMCLLKTETDMLVNSVEGFSKVRDDLDSQVDKIARSYMKTKCPKKLRFSDSLKQSSPVLNKNSEVSVIQNTVSEKEVLNYMSPVELAEDYFAQGDCPQITNKCIENSDGTKPSPKPVNDAELGLKPKFQNSASCMSEAYDRKIRGNTFKEAVKFNPSTSHNVQGATGYGGSMQNYEDLSELSSLSDLED